jgi:putative aldouronate transport system permease protein
VVSRVLHLKDTILALFLPNAMSTFNLILMKNYFLSIPESLEESAKIDGASELRILLRIVLPVSKPIVATILLFYSVFFWNDWFCAMLFVSSGKLSPLSLVLRNLILSTTNFMAQGLQRQIPDMIRAAVIIISIVPIMAVYPLIQKYFVQGIMLGSVKE